MFYTIKYAMSAKHPSIIIDLCKNGNRFEVMAWNRAEHKTIRKHLDPSFDAAHKVFEMWCEAFEMTSVKEAHPDFTAADFD